MTITSKPSCQSKRRSRTAAQGYYLRLDSYPSTDDVSAWFACWSGSWITTYLIIGQEPES